MANPVDALTVALPRPATAQHVNAAPTELVSPVTVRVPVVVPPTEPVSPVTVRVPVAVPPTEPVHRR